MPELGYAQLLQISVHHMGFFGGKNFEKILLTRPQPVPDDYVVCGTHQGFGGAKSLPRS